MNPALLMGLGQMQDVQMDQPEESPLLEIKRRLEEKQREERELENLASQESQVLKQMGITPTARRDQMIEADYGSKGKLGKVGSYLTEALRGAVQGKSYTPYSERMLQQATADDTAQRPFLKERLEGINAQKVQREKSHSDIMKALSIAQSKEGIAKALMDKNTKGLEGIKARIKANEPLVASQAGLNNAKALVQPTEAAVNTSRAAVNNANAKNAGLTLGIGGVPGQQNAMANDPAFAGKVTPILDAAAKRQQATNAAKISAQRAAKLAAPTKAPKFNDINVGRSKYQKEEIVKVYDKVKPAYEGLLAGYNHTGDRGVGDMDMLRYFALLTDPRTGVREGEYKDMANAGGVIRYLNQWKEQGATGLLGGKKLDNQLREDFFNIATKIEANYRARRDLVVDLYKRQADAVGLPHNLIFLGDEDAQAQSNTGAKPGVGNIQDLRKILGTKK